MDRDPSAIAEQGRILTRFVLLDEIDAATAARELAALPSLSLDGHYYWPVDLVESGKVEAKFAALWTELETLGIKPPAA